MKDVKEVKPSNGIPTFIGNKVTKGSQYDLNDEEISRVTLEGDVVVRLISNDKGVFIDIRKHYKGYPTKKGIRFAASKLINVYNLLHDDIINYVPNIKESINNK